MVSVSQLGTQLVGRGRDQRAHLIQRPGPVSAGAGAGNTQDADRFDVAVSSLRRAERVARERSSRCAHRVMRVGLPGPAASLPVRPIHLHDLHAALEKMTGQARAVAAGSFDTDHHDLTERREPLSELAIAVWCRRERRSSQQAAVVVQRGRDVHIEMGVDPTRDLCSHIRVFSCCSTSKGRHRPAGTADKTTTSLSTGS